MNRREALRNVALLMGGAISATTLGIITNGCNTSSDKNGELFSQHQQNIIAELADTIIPATDTPGAKVAAVGPFISMMVSDVIPKEFIKHL